MMVNGQFFGRLDKKKLEYLIETWRASGRVEE
jgi:NADH:ubiquinone oxidoreductase subunit E